MEEREEHKMIKIRKSNVKHFIISMMLILVMGIGIVIPSAIKADAASVSWSYWSGTDVSTSNAVVRIRANAPARVHWTGASGTIYDSNGNVVAHKSESANWNTTYMSIWYDITGEMGVKLKAGTTYKVVFTADYDGMRYTSPAYTFKTAAAQTSKNNSGSDKVSAFLNDSRWKAGTGWGYYQRPKVSSYDSIGCCAYTADFAKYVFGKDSPRGGSVFYSTSDIRANEILHIDGHWLVVLSRNGNSLTVAEGNVQTRSGALTQVTSDTWTISGNSLVNKWEGFGRTLMEGYHF
jgi:hypothetical protein